MKPTRAGVWTGTASGWGCAPASPSGSSRCRTTDDRPARTPRRSTAVKSAGRRSRWAAASTAAAPQADRLERPLRRRADRMARPARVRMRKRKPCVLARRRLFGWNVRLLTRGSVGLEDWFEEVDPWRGVSPVVPAAIGSPRGREGHAGMRQRPPPGGASHGTARPRSRSNPRTSPHKRRRTCQDDPGSGPRGGATPSAVKTRFPDQCWDRRMSFAEHGRCGFWWCWAQVVHRLVRGVGCPGRRWLVSVAARTRSGIHSLWMKVWMCGGTLCRGSVPRGEDGYW